MKESTTNDSDEDTRSSDATQEESSPDKSDAKESESTAAAESVAQEEVAAQSLQGANSETSAPHRPQHDEMTTNTPPTESEAKAPPSRNTRASYSAWSSFCHGPPAD